MVTVVTQQVGLLKNLSLLRVYEEVKTTNPVWCWCSLNLQKKLHSNSLKQVLRRRELLGCASSFPVGLLPAALCLRWVGALLLSSANVLKGWLFFVRIFTPENPLKVFHARVSLSWIIVFVLLVFWWGFFSPRRNQWNESEVTRSLEWEELLVNLLSHSGYY